MAELAIEVGFLTDVGRKRRHNEDFIDLYEPADPEELARSGRLYIVADGVGGGAAGEVASEYAVNKVLHEYYRSTEPDLGERLRVAIGAANADIFEHVEQRPELIRMGTTIVAAVVRGDELVVINVGDSRAYLIRNGEIHQITRDHSLVAKLVEEGSITPEEAEHHPERNVVLRSLGVDPDVYPDIFEGRLQPGDQIVLCSDGLTRHVSDEEILGVTTRTKVDRVVRQLVELANARGGKDNISVLLLRAVEAVSPSAVAETVTRRRVPVQPEFDTIHDTVSKRRKAPPRPYRPSHPSRPTWVWLAFGGAIGALVLLAVLFIGGRALGVIPALTSPVITPGSTTVLSASETLPPLLSPSPTPEPTAAPTPIPIATPAPTPVPTLPPIYTPAMDDPPGDVEMYDTGAPVEQPPAGLDIRGASVALDLRVELKPTTGIPAELVDWTTGEELLLWITLHEPIPISPTVDTDWLFALDLDGIIATGRPANSVRINPDLGDEAIIGVSYNHADGKYKPFFWVWDPAQGKWADGPEVVRFYPDESRTLIGLALPLETLIQTVTQKTGVTLVSEDVRGRAAAVSYEPRMIPHMIDFCPDLPQE